VHAPPAGGGGGPVGWFVLFVGWLVGCCVSVGVCVRESCVDV
jgi:hypothetical protein